MDAQSPLEGDDASSLRDQEVQEVPEEEVAEEMETEDPAAVSYREPLTIHSDLEKEEGEIDDVEYNRISASISLDAIQSTIADVCASGAGDNVQAQRAHSQTSRGRRFKGKFKR